MRKHPVNHPAYRSEPAHAPGGVTFGPSVSGTMALAKFRAMFDHEPKVDTRTPAQVRAL